MIREFSDPSSEPGVKRTTKKPRRIGDEPPDTGQSPSLSESPPSAMQGIQLSAPDTTAMDQPAPLPSYRDILLGNQLVPPILEDEIPDDDDVELIEGDVLHSTVDDVIEYKSLPTIFLECGHYGNVRDIFPSISNLVNVAIDHVAPPVTIPTPTHENSSYGPWMMVARCQSQSSRKAPITVPTSVDATTSGSRFNPIFEEEILE
ncbi:hypothetical protein V6N13_008111 [Hibiscus sabdariffa]